MRQNRFLKFYILLGLFIVLFPLTLPQSYALEINKKLLTGKFWYKKKYFYKFNEDGSYIKQLRLRGRKIIFTCKGTYVIEGNVLTCKGICPGSRDKFIFEVKEQEAEKIVATKIAFGAQLPAEGVRSQAVFKVHKEKQKKHKKRHRKKHRRHRKHE